MTWSVAITNQAEREIRRLTVPERTHIDQLLGQMRDDPFGADVKFLRETDGAMRRRTSDWRIIYDLVESEKLIVVMAVRRRASNTH